MNNNIYEYDIYVYVITALLPLSALILVVQVNPYHALVVQGILGAVATLVFALLGAADVALTQALMGTLLAIMLYVVAVRSSLVMRLGVLENHQDYQQIIDELRAAVAKYHLRLELVEYTNTPALQRALVDKEIHGTFTPLGGEEQPMYEAVTRVRRLHEIMQEGVTTPGVVLNYFPVYMDDDGKH